MRFQDLALTGLVGQIVSGLNWDLDVMPQFRQTLGDMEVSPAYWRQHALPVMDGTVAIDRDYFYKIGGYDRNITDQATAQVEMSLRVWMCGGSVVVEPCSVLYRIFKRLDGLHTRSQQDEQELQQAKARVALAWMDEYKDAFFDGCVLLRMLLRATRE
jgi:hypothetical protein